MLIDDESLDRNYRHTHDHFFPSSNGDDLFLPVPVTAHGLDHHPAGKADVDSPTGFRFSFNGR